MIKALISFAAIGVAGIAIYHRYRQNMPVAGHSKSLKELRRVFKFIHTWPLHKMAEYADNIAKEKLEHSETLVKSEVAQNVEEWQKTNAENFYSAWNTTSVGNLAYIAVHAKDTHLKGMAVGLLAGFSAYRKEKIKPPIANQ